MLTGMKWTIGRARISAAGCIHTSDVILMSYILKERLWIGVTCLPRKFLSSLVWEWYISVHFWWIMCDVKPHKPSNFAWHSSPAAAPSQQDIKPHKPSNFAWHSSPAAAPSLQLVWLCLWNKLKHQMSTGASDDERITVDVWQTCEWMECVDGM